MATQKIVAIMDHALNIYMRPFFVISEGQATRMFRDEVNRTAEDNQMNKHPEDFDLYCIGYFDEESGFINPEEFPRLLCRGKDMHELRQ